MMEWWPAIAGTVPGWITSAGVITLVGIVFTHLRGVRKLAIEARQVENVDEADIRDHYAGEVAALRAALAASAERARKVLEASESRHEDCVKSREELRDQGRELKDIVSGLIGIIRQNSAAKVLILDDEASEFVRSAAERINTMYRLRPHVPSGVEVA